MMKKGLSLFKAKKSYFEHLSYYKKNKHRLETETLAIFQGKLDTLKALIHDKKLDEAALCICEIEQLINKLPRPGFFKQTLSWGLYIFLTLLVVIVLRSMVVEPMKIPTGSMRPTLREQDGLVIGKTAFGLNIPFYPGHFYFNEKLVQRAQMAVWTTKGMPIPNSNTNYFLVFPGKKQMVKRIMGKGGDTVYFYGGRLYGIDRDGNDISKELEPDYLSYVDHVPFNTFDGTVKEKLIGSMGGSASLFHMNELVGTLTWRGRHRIKGHLAKPFADLGDFYNLWGFKNYGMSRILSEKEYLLLGDKESGVLEPSKYYLEIFHHPTLKHPELKPSPFTGNLTPSVGLYRAYLPLSDKNLKAINHVLYTARFLVKNGKIARYGATDMFSKHAHALPSITGVSDGTYEYYYGKAYKIYPLGIRKELPIDHKLMRLSSKEIQLFYNLGIECNRFYGPISSNSDILPSRYVYFKNGDLVTMNGPFLSKGEATLEAFNKNESEKAAMHYTSKPAYIPFQDYGAPVRQNGTIDKEFMLKYGFHIPEGRTLMLGDNYAMSSDSRSFGTVPYSQLRGSPLFIFFPPHDAFKPLPQPKLAPMGYIPLFVIAILVIVGCIEFIFFIRKYLLWNRKP